MLRFCSYALFALIFVSTAVSQEKTPPKPGTPKAPGQKIPDIPGYKQHTIEGFTVLLSGETLKQQETATYERKPVEVLEMEMKTVVSLLPERSLPVLRKMLIWVEWDEKEKMSNGRGGNAEAVYYGGHQASLLGEGKHPLKAKSVTVLRMKALTEEHQPKQESGRCVMLHEIAHAVHFELLGGADYPPIKAAYKQAMERKLYDPKMYVSTNEAEFFAELTCAYFDQLHHYPKTRADLKKHDPATHKMMEGVWGKVTRVASAKPAGSDKSKGDPELPLSKVELGKPLLGPKVTADDLKGHAAVLMLWNANSETSLASLTRLNAWDAELRDFGLTTVGIHLNGMSQTGVEGAVRSRQVSFAITERPWLAGGLIKDFKDFPLCLVFDHEGQCIFKGSPFDAEDTARATTGAALVAAVGLKEVPKELTPVIEALEKGKPPSSLMSRVVTLAKWNDKETADAAKQLLGKLTEAGTKALDDIAPLVKSDPVIAYLKLERLPVTYKDTLVAYKANELMTRLKQDKGVALELRARPALVNVKKMDTELGSRAGSFDPGSDAFQKTNAAVLRQLRDAVLQMKKSFPDTPASEEAVRIAEKYRLVVR